MSGISMEQQQYNWGTLGDMWSGGVRGRGIGSVVLVFTSIGSRNWLLVVLLPALVLLLLVVVVLRPRSRMGARESGSWSKN